MSKEYSPKEIEKKWQDIWDEEKAFKVSDDRTKPKYYALVEFPYPSGQGLHVGHPRPYTALDIIARKRRLQGYNVLYPMGWDAFGLPTENFAIKNKIHPKEVTKNNVARFKAQLKSLGYSFDWDREINTTDPEYYKWTQWIFLKLFKAGLAYKSEMPINWCTSCKVGLANEEVVNGVCERCGSPVVHKVKSQWMLKITEYADKLIEGLDDVDYIEKVKVSQKNWIGRSEGAEVDFALTGVEDKLTIYTTRPDTLFGATYMVISPEHPLIDKYKDIIENYDEIVAYRQEAQKKSDFERTELAKDKTGVELKGIKAINPVNGKETPVWISDYVLMTYGTGAIMAVPAHDTRDFEFAKKFGLPIIEVVAGGDVTNEAYTDTKTGKMVNSGFLDGLEVADAKVKIIEFLTEKGIGHKKVNYKLRDWVFSRQRYWGEPIPIVHCDCCGYVPVPESELPLKLPEVESYMPTDNGESPLAAMTDWVNTTCPKCGKPAKRETDTMPQWAGSSWYFLRYTDPHNTEAFASKEALDYWLPVDWYNGGMEHTTLHLLYSRFWHKFLYDQGLVSTKEPYMKRTSHGMILGNNGEKMSKSRGNVVNPDDIVNEFGADTLRTYEMFIGAFELSASWSNEGVRGCRRFLERVWKLQDMVDNSNDGYSKELETKMHQTIKKVSTDYEAMKFNTAIAALMSLVNDFYKAGSLTRGEFKTLLVLLNPVASHMTEELWEIEGFEGRLYNTTWPEYDEAKTVEDTVEIAIQVNGKVKGTVKVGREEDEASVKAKAHEVQTVANFLEGKNIVKEIYVKGKIFNIVAK
ncbi:MAG: leucine--tRNA ligase [Lachnospiraceae bacterium]|uniref:leucine--tRNA ligase n=1 Tax=Falcatimonas sp. MSJ-15 TaxID=2841515 RepID=UPI001C113A5D|nr:leucine--tRNA ligase [Falcatimonas sp. MSJ-15]MBQ5735642.1 leucine--tRNA ligase [Lachnospiraceae bacterium]MBU5468873.1 leucine--tRNA ligase [Falcatimonas sp. MSJ-15]MEE0960675.1 leucine--tRNA ligase [Lachnospiraceae bacterium]